MLLAFGMPRSCGKVKNESGVLAKEKIKRGGGGVLRSKHVSGFVL